MRPLQRIKQFQKKVSEICDRELKHLDDRTAEHLSKFERISLETFSNDNPYEGEVKNKIFFTYSDHYYANSPLYMQLCELSHPYINYEDRGYIKGVATDLEGYLKLRSAASLSHYLFNEANIFLPYFQKSLHRAEYIQTCKNLIENACKELDVVVKAKKDIMNNRLKELTNCSLLHYIQNI